MIKTERGRSEQPKVAELEAIRGVAAIVVVNTHFAVSFLPWVYDRAGGVFGSVFAAAFNGHAAVVVFFVLSGFVLPLGYFASDDIDMIVRAAAKRWFRLVFLVVIATMSSYLLLRFGLYHYKEAGGRSGSVWLATFAGTEGTFQPTLIRALAEGTVLAFLRDTGNFTSPFDAALWTMYHEFFGSFVTFGLAILLKRSSPVAAAGYTGGALACVLFTDARLISFVIGTALAYYASRRPITLSTFSGSFLAVAGLYLFGYHGVDRGAYEIMSLVSFHGPYGDNLIFVHSASAVLLIYAALGAPRIATVLSAPFFRFLGRVSFPVYVIHVPLIFSLIAYLFVRLQAFMSYGSTIAIAAAALGAAVIPVGYGLALADEAWLRFINRQAKRFIPSRHAPIALPVRD